MKELKEQNEKKPSVWTKTQKRIVVAVLVVGIATGAIVQEIRFSSTLPFSQMEAIYTALGIAQEKALEDYTKEELVDFMLNGLADGLNDDYSHYFTAAELAEYNDQKQGIIRGGIGVTISKTEQGIAIAEVYEDSPAGKAGLRAGDIFLEVDGTDVTAKTTTELAELAGGEEGTSVRIRVKREENELVFDVIRALVQTPMVKYRNIDEITYIQLKSFNGNAVSLFKEALDSAQSSNAKGIIIDLRDNLGGDLSILAQTADMILPEGVIIYALDKQGNRISERKSSADCVDIPMVILVNGYSASASEAFAGAARDHKTAVLVGTKTFGKGIMQTTYPLANSGAFKLTTAKYYLPGGQCIHGTGITPDYVVTLPDDQESRPINMTDAEDTQLQKALDILK